MTIFYATALWCPLWVTERWMVLSPRQVSGRQLWTVSQAVACQASGQFLSTSWWIMTLKAAGGGEEGWLFASCCLGRNRLFPLSYPPLDSELLKWYLATSNWHPKTNWQICFLSLNSWKIWVICGSRFQRFCESDILIISSQFELFSCNCDFEDELKPKEHITYVNVYFCIVF